MILIEDEDNAPKDETDDFAMFITNCFEKSEDEEENSKFDEIVCKMIDVYDEITGYLQAYMVDIELNGFTKVIHHFLTYTTFAVNKHLLLNTGATKTICNEDLLQCRNWHPIVVQMVILLVFESTMFMSSDL